MPAVYLLYLVNTYERSFDCCRTVRHAVRIIRCMHKTYKMRYIRGKENPHTYMNLGKVSWFLVLILYSYLNTTEFKIAQSFNFVFLFLHVVRNLQTIETAQRRGLATLILRIYCKEFATRENLDVIAYYQIANKASATIFASLGFEEYRQCSWVKMKHI